MLSEVKNDMKKFKAIFLCFTLICLLAGCNSENPPSTSNMETSQATETETTQSSEIESSQTITPDTSSSQAISETEENTAESEYTQISIEIGDITLSGELDDSVLAEDFAALLPQTISMQRVGGGREFYGSIDGSLTYDEADAQTTFENGDIAYWFSGNGLCLLYNNQVEEPEVESGIIVIGKITSDFSVLYDMDDNITATISLAE